VRINGNVRIQTRLEVAADATTMCTSATTMKTPLTTATKQYIIMRVQKTDITIDMYTPPGYQQQ